MRVLVRVDVIVIDNVEPFLVNVPLSLDHRRIVVESKSVTAGGCVTGLFA